VTYATYFLRRNALALVLDTEEEGEKGFFIIEYDLAMTNMVRHWAAREAERLLWREVRIKAPALFQQVAELGWVLEKGT